MASQEDTDDLYADLYGGDGSGTGDVVDLGGDDKAGDEQDLIGYDDEDNKADDNNDNKAAGNNADASNNASGASSGGSFIPPASSTARSSSLGAVCRSRVVSFHLLPTILPSLPTRLTEM